METQEKQSSGNKIFMILTFVLVAISGVLGWQLYSQKTQKELVIVEKNNLISEKDQMQSELTAMLAKYDSLQTTNGSLSADLEAERAKIIELQQQLEKATSDASSMRKYKNEVAALKKKQTELETEIATLKQANEQLVGENTKVKGDLSQQQNVNKELTSENMNLASTVAKGKLLAAYEVAAQGIQVKGTKTKPTTKAKKADKIETCFILGENKIADRGNKEIYIRIEDPTGQVLAKGLGESNEITVNGQKVAVSMKEDVEYTNAAMPLCISYTPSTPLNPGTYKISVYADKTEIGNTKFDLK
jgi:hypothetical protein